MLKSIRLHIEKDENPSQEKIVKYHTMYKQAIKELFNNYRDIYDPKVKNIEFV